LAPSRIDEAKRALAQNVRAVRTAAHRDRGRVAATEICDQLQRARDAGLKIDRDTIISAYWPMRDELDTRKLLVKLHGEGTQCALPVMQHKDKPLSFRRWRPSDVLEEASFGVAEPMSDQPILIPEIMLVPLLAVDGNGNRLGYGGGYYDRTLLQRRQGREGPVVAVGVAYDAQRVPVVPHDEGDARLDWLITEQGFKRFGPV
jgi:5-formyltetrahydrofolate cyclo-ligase